MIIAYCISGTYNSGGMERVLANKANWLSQHGYQVHIITTDQQGRTPFFALNAAVTQHDLGINYSQGQTLSLIKKSASYITKQQQHRRRLNQLLHKLQPQVVISMFDHDAAFLYKIHPSSKKVLEIHFSRFKRLQYNRTGLWKLTDRLRSRHDKMVAGRYNKFIVLTHEDAGYWGSMPNIAVIPNAQSFYPAVPAALTAQTVIAVGRYDYQKNFEDLIKAWAIVAAAQPAWHLNIYGHGPLQHQLQQLINGSGLQQHITLQPPVANIQQAYLAASMLVLTSRYEGLPMALLEAQACGLPMVSYTCKCGPKDVITHGQNGYLVPEGDYNTLARKILKLAEDTPLRMRMGTAARTMAQQYSTYNVMQQWHRLFTNL